jgi:hypothetical protein
MIAARQITLHRLTYCVSIAFVVFLLTPAQSKADLISGALYGIVANPGGTPETHLIQIDPLANPFDNSSWSVVATFANDFESFEIGNDGSIYATSGLNNSRYSLDENTGNFSLIGDCGIVLHIEGLAMSSDGTLFGSDLVNADLVTFNTSTGAATVIGSFNGPNEIAGLSFAPDRTLYETNYDGALYEINQITGPATMLDGSERYLGLAIDPDDSTI